MAVTTTPRSALTLIPVDKRVDGNKTPMLLLPSAYPAAPKAPENVPIQRSVDTLQSARPLAVPAYSSLIPQGTFGGPVKPGQANAKPSPTAVTLPERSLPPLPFAKPAIAPVVLLYASRASQAYLEALGIDSPDPTQIWEVLLRKHAVAYQLIKSVRELEAAPATTLVLPSTVALSDTEKQAIVMFQRKGGSIVSTWLTGVRDEMGAWRGFGFMENALGAKVVGTTEDSEEDTFLVPHGDNPVSHRTAAGLKIWMARIEGWYPLRMVGKHSAANFMDWSRAAANGKHSSTIIFDEREQPTGQRSRSVVLGFAEKLWASAEAQTLEPLILDALTWAMREPRAYLAAWPSPYSSAFVLAIDAADTMADTDLKYGKLTGDLGGRATYYVLTEKAAQASAILNKITASGHEVAYLADRFEKFKDQSTNAQSKRIDTMLREMKSAGVEMTDHAGFHPPLESYDKATERSIKDKGFGYLVAGLDASEARLPFLLKNDAKRPLVVLPRTQSDPDDLISEGGPIGGLKLFFTELDLVDKMGGLSIARLSNRSSLTDSQFAEFSQHLQSKRNRIWMASGAQVAQWWRERENINATFDFTTNPAVLSVKIQGDQPLQNAASIWVNLPKSNVSLRLEPTAQYEKSPKIASVDAWRSAVVLTGFPPGQYRWYVHFDQFASGYSQ